MTTALVFAFGLLLSLLFLGMIHGDRLGLLGLFDGSWLSPITRLLGELRVELCDGMERIAAFVFSQLSWVVAGTTGTIGLCLVGYVLFSGITADAETISAGAREPLLFGSVIDTIPEVTSRTGIRPADPAPDPSYAIEQFKGGRTYVFHDVMAPPFDERDLQLQPELPFSFQPLEDAFPSGRSASGVPLVNVEFQRLGNLRPEADYDSITTHQGRLIGQSPLPEVISATIRRLQLDDWRDATLRHRWIGNPVANSGSVPESSPAAIRSLEDGVVVIPGDSFSEQDLRVEKSIPRVSSGPVTVEIRLLNVGIASASGILVREYLPPGARLTAADGEARYRNSVITWLINDLRPYDERVLRFTVMPETDFRPGNQRFLSETEVSMATAVTTPITVGNSRTETRPPADPEFPPIEPIRRAQKPDLRMTVNEPLTPVRIGEEVTIFVDVTNVGTAPAREIGLRVNLNPDLNHWKLTPGTRDRFIVNAVEELQPQQTTRIRLVVQPAAAGTLVSTAEMIFQGERLIADVFEVVAEN